MEKICTRYPPRVFPTLPLFARGLALLLCLGVSALAAAASYYPDATRYYAKGELNAAAIQLKNLLRDDPRHAEGRLLLGQIHLDTGNFSAAEKELERAMDLGIDPERLLRPLAQAYMGQDKIKKLLLYVDPDKTSSDSGKSTAHLYRGYAQLSRGDLHAARTSFNRALQFQNNGRATLGLARLAAQEHNYAQAHELLQAVIASGLETLEARILEGDIYARQHQQPLAQQAYEEGLKHSPDHLGLHLKRAEILLAQHKTAEAEKDLKFVLERSRRHPGAAFLMSRIRLAEQNFEQAQEYSEWTLQFTPNHAPAFFVMGAALFGRGQHEQALEYLDRFLQVAPGFVPAVLIHSVISLHNGEADNVVRRIEPLIQAGIEDGKLYALLGQALAQTGQTEASLEALDKAAELSPGLTQLGNQRALINLMLGQSSSAVDLLTRAGEPNASDDNSALLLTLSYIQNQQYDQAHATLARWQQEQPDNPLFSQLRGAAYLQQKAIAQAQEQFQHALKARADYPPAVFALGHLARAAADYPLAETYYRQLLAGSKKGQAEFELARVALLRHDQDQAREWLEKSMLTRPDASATLSLLGSLYLQQHQPLKALSAVQAFASRNPKHPAALSLRARIMLATNDLTRAERALRQILQRQPNDIAHRLQLAGLLQRKGEFDQALSETEAILDAQPNHDSAWLTRTQLLLQQKRPEQVDNAIRALTQRKASGYLIALIQGDLHRYHNNLPAAENSYRAAYRQQAGSHQAASLTSVLLAQNKLADAIRFIDNHLTNHPFDQKNRLMLANLLLGKDDLARARQEYDQVIQQQPHNVVALNNLAWLYLEQDLSKAKTYAQQANKLMPEHPAIADTLGWIYLLEDNVTRGLALVEDASKGLNGDLQNRYHLAYGYSRAGRTQEARNVLSTLLADKRVDTLREKPDAQALLESLE